MKKIDIQNIITKYLSDKPIIIYDALHKQYNVSSYEEYLEFFSLIKNTYQNSIMEYYDESKKYLDLMNDLINKSMQNSDDDSINQYINNNFRSSLNLNYNNVLNIECISPKSFLIQRECSQEAFTNIYKELGYDMLQNYIELVRAPSNFTSYLNDSKRQIIAMKFLLFKTDHHSPSGFKRDTSAKTIFNETSKNISETLDDITKEKDDFITYMNQEKEHYKDWFQKSSKELTEFEDEHSAKLLNLETTYEEKLKVEKPAKFMSEQANKYKISFYLWCAGIMVLSCILLILLAIIIHPQVSFNDKLVTINVLSKDMPIYSSIILLATISLIIYVLRVFIKMAISAKHLMEEYKQKYSLTYFYLSLVNNGNIENENSRNIILASLFTKADTGLIKNDNSSDNAISLLSQLQSIK